MNIQTNETLIQLDAVAGALSQDSLDSKRDALIYSFDRIDASATAVSGNILTVGFFVMVSLLFGIVGFLKGGQRQK